MRYGLYKDYVGMMKEFVRVNRGRYSLLCLDLKDFIDWVESIDKAKQMAFMYYAMDKHKAYVMDVINGNYKLIDRTKDVWSGYAKYVEESKDEIGTAIGTFACGLMVMSLMLLPVIF